MRAAAHAVLADLGLDIDPAFDPRPALARRPAAGGHRARHLHRRPGAGPRRAHLEPGPRRVRGAVPRDPRPQASGASRSSSSRTSSTRSTRSATGSPCCATASSSASTSPASSSASTWCRRCSDAAPSRCGPGPACTSPTTAPEPFLSARSVSGRHRHQRRRRRHDRGRGARRRRAPRAPGGPSWPGRSPASTSSTPGSSAIQGRDENLAGGPRSAISLGVVYSSENRRSEGIISELSVQENITLALQAERGVLRRIRPARQRELALSWVDALDIRPRGPGPPGRHPLRRQPAEGAAGAAAGACHRGSWCSTSRPAASTSAPRSRCRTWSASSPTTASRSCSSRPSWRRCCGSATGSRSCWTAGSSTPFRPRS